MGRLLDALGRLLAALGRLPGASRTPLGRSWAPLELSWAHLGCILASWEGPGRSWGGFWSLQKQLFRASRVQISKHLWHAIAEALIPAANPNSI